MLRSDKLLAQSVLCRALSDDLDSVRLSQVRVSDPAPGEVRVRLYACAVNFPDLLMIRGKYQFKPPLPFAPGGEAAGVVEAVGAQVSRLREGAPVIVAMRYGGFSELVNVPAEAVRPKPARLSYAKAASYQTAYLTAHVALVRRAALQPGEVLLVHGATGGVGMAAADLGKRLGARVIATGSRDDKLAIVKARGADEVLNYSSPDGRLGGFRDAVKALTDGRGADIIYDPVGGDVFDESMRCVNWGGRILTIGFTSGRWPQAPVNLILIKGISVVGVRAGEYCRRHPEQGREINDILLQMASNGDIDPYVCKGFPLHQAADAMRLLENREVVGKTVVTMNGYQLAQPTP